MPVQRRLFRGVVWTGVDGQFDFGARFLMRECLFRFIGGDGVFAEEGPEFDLAPGVGGKGFVGVPGLSGEVDPLLAHEGGLPIFGEEG